MKKIYYYILFCTILSCSKDETKTRRIQLSYAETEINFTFRTEGSVAPIIIDWNGDAGTYSITSSTDILQQGIISFDTLTGQLSWGKDFPVGTYDFSITAKSGETTTTEEITLTNTFTKGFFSGGFKKVDDPDDTIFAIAIDYGLRLNEDGTISMERYSNPALLFSGNWSITEEGKLSVAFLTNLSGGVTTYMNGFISYDEENKQPLFRGDYGSSLDENQEIENPTGIFHFFWD
jgi:hypothetical protein